MVLKRQRKNTSSTRNLTLHGILHSELARESFEPQTEPENDELLRQFRIQSVSEVFGITVRMHRSLTNDDALETSEVAEGPALGYQRAHDCRVAVTTAFFKFDAINRIPRASAASSVAGYRPTVGDWIKVHRHNRDTSSRRWRDGPDVVVQVSGSMCWAVLRPHLLKLATHSVAEAAARMRSRCFSLARGSSTTAKTRGILGSYTRRPRFSWEDEDWRKR